jgi:hypothetical protein
VNADVEGRTGRQGTDSAVHDAAMGSELAAHEDRAIEDGPGEEGEVTVHEENSLPGAGSDGEWTGRGDEGKEIVAGVSRIEGCAPVVRRRLIAGARGSGRSWRDGAALETIRADHRFVEAER